MIRVYDQSLLRPKRILLSLSTGELSEHCGLTRQTIRNIEKGRSKNPSTILLIGLVLDILAECSENETIKMIFSKLD